MGKTKPPPRYKAVWEEDPLLRGWMIPRKYGRSVECDACKCTLKAYIWNLKKHARSDYHKQRWNPQENNNNANAPIPPVENQMEAVDELAQEQEADADAERVEEAEAQMEVDDAADETEAEPTETADAETEAEPTETADAETEAEPTETADAETEADPTETAEVNSNVENQMEAVDELAQEQEADADAERVKEAEAQMEVDDAADETEAEPTETADAETEAEPTETADAETEADPTETAEVNSNDDLPITNDKFEIVWAVLKNFIDSGNEEVFKKEIAEISINSKEFLDYFIQLYCQINNENRILVGPLIKICLDEKRIHPQCLTETFHHIIVNLRMYTTKFVDFKKYFLKLMAHAIEAESFTFFNVRQAARSIIYKDSCSYMLLSILKKLKQTKGQEWISWKWATSSICLRNFIIDEHLSWFSNINISCEISGKRKINFNLETSTLENNLSLECSICRDIFNHDEKLPKLLPCGHLICKTCASSIMTADDVIITFNCPLCRAPTKIQWSQGSTTIETVVQAQGVGPDVLTTASVLLDFADLAGSRQTVFTCNRHDLQVEPPISSHLQHQQFVQGAIFGQREVAVGEKVSLEVTLTPESGAPHVSWQLEGRPIDVLGGYRFISEPGRVELQIDSARPDHAGGYLVTIRNGNRVDRSSHWLSVTTPLAQGPSPAAPSTSRQ